MVQLRKHCRQSVIAEPIQWEELAYAGNSDCALDMDSEPDIFDHNPDLNHISDYHLAFSSARERIPIPVQHCAPLGELTRIQTVRFVVHSSVDASIESSTAKAFNDWKPTCCPVSDSALF